MLKCQLIPKKALLKLKDDSVILSESNREKDNGESCLK